MSFSPVDAKLSSDSFPARRGQVVLSAIIEEYLTTGEPVGSKSVADKFINTAGWSSATIRNVMGELEEAGLLTHPHTSAGRLPTDSGYRFYVDNLLGVLQISADDLTLINEHFGISSFEINFTPERFLERTSQLLSNLSQNIGIVVSPSLAENQLEHIKFVNLADKRILVALVSAPNLVHHKVIRLENAITQEELDRTAQYLNSEFTGESLTTIRRKILNLMHEEKALFDSALRRRQLRLILAGRMKPNDAAELKAIFDQAT